MIQLHDLNTDAGENLISQQDSKEEDINDNNNMIIKQKQNIQKSASN